MHARTNEIYTFAVVGIALRYLASGSTDLRPSYNMIYYTTIYAVLCYHIMLCYMLFNVISYQLVSPFVVWF